MFRRTHPRTPTPRPRPDRPFRASSPRSRIALAAALLALLALAGPAPAPAAAAPAADNLALAIEPAMGINSQGSLAAFAVSELMQGKDYTGDGDVSDFVVAFYSSATGRAAVGKASMRGNRYSSFCFNGNVLAFITKEDGQHDYNGDGDRSDHVLMTWDVVNDDYVAADVAASSDSGVACGGGRVAYQADEADEQRDMNGDGDRIDHIWHVYRLSDGNNHNLELAGLGHLHFTARMNGRALVFQVHEPHDHEDLNGDGDLDDRSVASYVFGTGYTVNSRYAGNLQYDEREKSAKAYGRWQPFRADEAEEGEDINGDGDQLDVVSMAIDTRNGRPRIGAAGDMVRSTGRWLTLVIDEAAEGNQDLTGDGDTLDHVLVFENVFGGARWNTGMAVSFGFTSSNTGHPAGDHGIGFHGRKVSAEISEASTGMDLDGDGFANDKVIVRFDPANNSTFVTGALSRCWFDNEKLLPVNADFAFACRRESVAPAADLNGDGDLNDTIAQSVSLSSGALASTGVALDLTDPMRLAGDTAFIAVREASEGNRDLNGDGDTLDEVLHLVDLNNGNTHNMGLDIHDLPDTESRLIWRQTDRHLLFGVNEWHQGSDLNRDGDLGDTVLHALAP